MTCRFWCAVLSVFSSGVIDAQHVPEITRDIVYATVDGVDLRLDMARPSSGPGPFPAVLHFHGGGWQAGGKSHGHQRIIKLAQSGYVAVSVGYRFAPQYKWPDQVLDAKAAVRFLRLHAHAYNIDPDRIGAGGDSAGGYLALMLGLTGTEDGFEGSNPGNVSSHVNAVVSFCSAGDFTRSGSRKLPADVDAQIAAYYKKPLKQVLTEFTGVTRSDDPKLTRMSAKTYVDAGDVPVLIFQGERDPLISMEQVRELDERLRGAGVYSEVVLVEGEAHGWQGKALEDTERKMIAFFDQWLAKR